MGDPQLARDGKSVDLANVEELEEATSNISRFLLEFFVENHRGTPVMRPLTNSNFVLDFYRYRTAPYHSTMTQYLQYLKQDVPDYEMQYRDVTKYYRETKLLHKYGKFTLDGAMSSTPNTKSLQLVSGTDDAVRKLARGDYYKFRAANFMFGFNSGILHGLENFSEFNALRKNQLLRFYRELQPAVADCGPALKMAKNATKYRDYCESIDIGLSFLCSKKLLSHLVTFFRFYAAV